jgi:hypothetical protein
MGILTTIPAELLAAAQQLEGIGNSLTAQNAAAAAPTTSIAPPAADQVSTLQAAVFSSYGTLYQQIAAEAAAIQQQFTSTLGLSSGTYTATEAANAQAGDPFSQLEDFLNNAATFLGGPLGSSGGSPFSTSGNAANFLSFEGGNWASAMSDTLGMAGGGLIPTDAGAAAGDAAAGAADVNTVAPAGGMGGMGGGVGAVPMAGVGQATMVSSMSAPPSWAGTVTPVAGTTAATPITAGWTGAAPQAGAPVAAMPGMPGAGAAARGSALGAPRYGVKPIVMPKLKAV